MSRSLRDPVHRPRVLERRQATVQQSEHVHGLERLGGGPQPRSDEAAGIVDRIRKFVSRQAKAHQVDVALHAVLDAILEALVEDDYEPGSEVDVADVVVRCWDRTLELVDRRNGLEQWRPWRRRRRGREEDEGRGGVVANEIGDGERSGSRREREGWSRTSENERRVEEASDGLGRRRERNVDGDVGGRHGLRQRQTGIYKLIPEMLRGEERQNVISRVRRRGERAVRGRREGRGRRMRGNRGRAEGGRRVGVEDTEAEEITNRNMNGIELARDVENSEGTSKVDVRDVGNTTLLWHLPNLNLGLANQNKC